MQRWGSHHAARDSVMACLFSENNKQEDECSKRKGEVRTTLQGAQLWRVFSLKSKQKDRREG